MTFPIAVHVCVGDLLLNVLKIRIAFYQKLIPSMHSCTHGGSVIDAVYITF